MDPIPPVVYGPITVLSTAVRVVAGRAGYTLIVYDNGEEIGRLETSETKEYWVPLHAKPTLGHHITARISSGRPDGQLSEPSVTPVQVIEIPDPLPTPIISSDLNTCMTDIRADGLVAGAKVVTMISGEFFGSVETAQPRFWLGIDRTKAIQAGAKATIYQEVTIGSSIRKSPIFESPSIPKFVIQGKVLPSPLLGPLASCDTERHYLRAVPGAEIRLEHARGWETCLSPSTSFVVHGGSPLLGKDAVVTQTMPRCGYASEPITVPVSPPAKPPTPTISHKLCPDVLHLLVSNLEPGGILYVYQRVTPPTGQFTDTLVGWMGIARSIQSVYLPPTLSVDNADGIITIRVDQQRCDGTSDPAIVQIAQVGRASDPPRIAAQPFACQRHIALSDAHPGALVQAMDEESEQPLCDWTPVESATIALELYFELEGGRKIYVRQKGCNADGESQRVRVEPLPQVLPEPKITAPIRPHAPQIEVREVLLSAKLYLYVNNELRPGTLTALSSTVFIKVLGEPLKDNDLVYVVQGLCNRYSPYTGHGVRVQRGRMKVHPFTSRPLIRNEERQVTVFATDTETNVEVAGSVWLNGIQVGLANYPFMYHPKLGDPNPNGFVKEPLAYFDEAFTIELSDPVSPTEPANLWTIKLTATPNPIYLESIVTKVEKLSWKLTPDWDTTIEKTVQGVMVGNTVTATVTLPKPTGTIKSAVIKLEGTGTTEGGTHNGYTFEKQQLLIWAESLPTTFDGNLAVGWILQPPEYLADGFDGKLRIIALWQGTGPL